MKLYELMDSIEIEGNIRLSVWNGDEEIASEEFREMHGLCSHDLFKAGHKLTVDGDDTEVCEWEWYEVTHIFCSFGFLNIELREREEV